jgi:hypothetical protein
VIRHDCYNGSDASNWKFNEPQELFREYRLWVACEADEELPHLVRFLGEDNLIIGSDYGHNDPSKDFCAGTLAPFMGYEPGGCTRRYQKQGSRGPLS